MRMFAFLLSGAALLSAAAGEGETGGAAGVSSSIRAVTVYGDRALVTREAELRLEQGLREVTFARLPAAIYDDSIRASGRGTARVTILGVETEREFTKEAVDERVRALQDRIETMEEEDAALKDRAAAVDLQMKFVESIKSSVGERISREMLMRSPEPGQWKKVVGFIGDEYDALGPALRGTEKKRRDLQREIGAAKKKLKEIISLLPREQKNVTVSLDVAAAGSLTLDLSYMVGGAGWSPCYDARAERDRDVVEVTYCGRVRQRTGEDWSNVALELSTARPSIGGSPPELFPWYITYARPPRLMKKRAAAAPMALGVVLDEEAVGRGMKQEAPREAEIAQAEVGRLGEAMTFRIRKPSTIPGDGSVRKVVIAPLTMKAEYRYFTVPKLAGYAYLMARVTNGAAYPLRAGRVSVFRGPEFVGTSSIKHVASGETFELYLGVDDKVTVKRKLVAEKAERSLVRRKTGWKSFRYRIEIENHGDGNESVIVLDQVPVSKEPDVTVSLESASPDPVKLEKWEKPGFLTWKLELAPKEKKTVEFGFSVSYPKDKDIRGL